MMFEYAEDIERLADIKVAGVGGAGGNAVGRMIAAGLSGVEFLAVNTDLQALKDSPAHQTMQIGAQLTKGLGSGGDPARGRAAAEEDRDTIARTLAGADMVFVTAGMGGGTGTGAAPVIAEIARHQGALTVGIVTKPFLFEGSVRQRQALEGIERLREAVDTMIIIPNQRLLEVVPPSTSMQEAFRIADNVLYDATRGIYEIISRHDHVNLDFADVRTVMKDMGEAMMGTGRAEGENRAVEAAKAAINSPLLENIDIKGSQAVLVNVLGREVGLQDTAAAMQYIQDAAGPEAHVIFGYGNDEEMGDTLQVTVIATGFQGAPAQARGSFAAAVNEDPDVLLDRIVDATGGPEPAEAAPAEPAAAAEPVVETAAEPAPRPVEDPAPAPAVAAETPSAPEAEFETEAEFEIEAEPAPEPAASAVAWAPDEEISGPEVAPAVEAEPAAAVVQPEAAPEPMPEPAPTPEPAPAPSLADRVVLPQAPTPARAAAVRGDAADEGFLRRFTARGGGADAETPSPSGAGRFLSRVSVRPLGEVEVPEAPEAPPAVTRSTAAGIGPQQPGDDVSAPAYTRKYMD